MLFSTALSSAVFLSFSPSCIAPLTLIFKIRLSHLSSSKAGLKALDFGSWPQAAVLDGWSQKTL